MKHILLLIAVAFAAHAFELDFTKNVYKTAWWSANKQLDRCSLTVQKDKRTGVQALCAQWDGSVTNYMHAMLIDGKDMPVFKRAKFTAVVSVNMPLAVNAVQLRLQDKNLETFYWKKNIKFDKPGSYVLEYVVDTERLAATSISSFTKDANKTIDFPLSTFALSFNFPQDGTPGEAFIHSIVVTELANNDKPAESFPRLPLAKPWVMPFDLPQRIPYNDTLEKAANPLTGETSLKMTHASGKGKVFGVDFTRFTSPRGILGPKIGHYDAADCVVNITTMQPLPQIKTLKLEWFESHGGLKRLSFPVQLDKAGHHAIKCELPPVTTPDIPYGHAPKEQQIGQLWVLMNVRFEADTADFDGDVYFNSIDLNVARSPLENIVFQLDTGKVAAVVEDASQGVKATLTNISSQPVSCRVVGTLKDTDGEPQPWTMDEKIDFRPGETKSVGPVAVPEKYGVYYVDLTLSTDGCPDLVRERTFAHMKLTGEKTDEKFVQGFKFGSVCHVNPMLCAPQEIEKAAVAMSQIGLRILRVDFGWIDNPLHIQWLDNVVDIFSSHGMNFDFILGYIMDKNGILMDTSMKCYGNLFKRFKGRVQYWEMLNEPDLPWGRKNPPQSTDYAKLAKATGELLRQIDPKAQFMSAGFCQLMGRGRPELPDFHQAAMKECWQVFDVHCFHGHGHFQSYADRIIDGNLLPKRKELGITIPWYANETAITSAVCTEIEQAETLYKKLLFSWGRGAIGYTWYNLREKGELRPNGEFQYGMLTHDFYPKPVYAAYNALTGIYQDKEYFATLDLPKGQWGFAFKSDSEIAVCLWNQTLTDTVVLKSDATAAETIDIFGNRKPLELSNGIVAVPNLSEPVNVILKNATTVRKLPSPAVFKMPDILLPEQDADIVISLNNPFATEQKATAKLRFPENVEVSRHEFTGIVPANGHLDFTAKIRLKNSTVGMGGTEWLFAETSIGSLPSMCQLRKIPVPTMVAPSLDGKPLMVMNDNKTLTDLLHGDPAHEHHLWKGAKDLSASFWLDVKDGALVVQVVVEDDVHLLSADDVAANRVWQGDSVQMFITPMESEKHFQLEYARQSDSSPYSFLRTSPNGFKPDASKLQLETMRKGTQTTYLINVPTDALGVSNDFFTKPFRFNIMVNDNDDNIRESWMAMAPGIGNGVNIQQHPVILFGKKK